MKWALKLIKWIEFADVSIHIIEVPDVRFHQNSVIGHKSLHENLLLYRTLLLVI